MTTALLFQGTASDSDLSSTLERLSSVKGLNWQVIAASQPNLPSLKFDFFSASGKSFKDTLATALGKLTDSNLLFIDAASGLEARSLEKLTAGVDKHINLGLSSTKNEWAEPGASSLVPLLSSQTAWPLAAVGISRNCLSIDTITAASSSEALIQLSIQGIGAGKKVSLHNLNAGSQSAEQLSSQTTARCLQLALDSCNIESLFPDYPWSRYQQESAAASYHSMAAIFLHLDDLNACSECLRLADKFEDSPRSLAIKGLLSARRGEVLGAVANMIASLQLYEQRKRNDKSSHYLSFSPVNLETVNGELSTGLSALNKQDNSLALTHFATAVFHFDSFYKEYKIASIA